ncbi:MAG: hypothetical protein P8I94_04150 [Emcibacteraceae bacterium]|nr:hypothetical protein [Emcibacteraceae bacterium]
MANFTVTNAYANSQYASYAGYNDFTLTHGSITPTTLNENDFSNADVLFVYWSPSQNKVYLGIEGIYSKEAITSLVIGSSTYSGSSSTHLTNLNFSNTDYTRWEWSTTTNDFGTVNGTQIAVSMTTASSAPAAIPAYGGNIADQTIAFDATGNLSLTISLNTGADSGEEAFKISEQSQLSTAIATTAPYYTSSTISIPAANLPTQGNTKTYYLFAYRYASADPEGDEFYRLTSSFTVTREVNSGSGGGVGSSATYGVSIFDSAGNLTLGMSDSVAFFKATGSVSVNATGTTDISVPGVTTNDFAFTTQVFTDNYSVRASIPSNGTVRIHVVKHVTSASSETFNYSVINIGD